MTDRVALRRPEDFSQLIDSTLLKADATPSEIDRLCDEAVRFGFYAVCVAPCYIERAVHRLKDRRVKVVSVVGFPLGSGTIRVKILEAVEALKQGADELDMVVNIGVLKSGGEAYVRDEVMNIANVCRQSILKVILETGALNRRQIALGARLAMEGGANWLKTSTGISYRGASVGDVRFLKKCVGESGFVKASGGIRDLQTARKMIRAGASRIGTSHGAALMREMQREAGRRHSRGSRSARRGAR